MKTFVKLKNSFVNDLNIKNANSKILNKYVIYLLNDYAIVNIYDYDLWNAIQIDSTRFQTEHFDQLKELIWILIRNYCYSREYWIDNTELDETRSTSRATEIIKTVNAQYEKLIDQ
jgi:hypothetical protein